MFTVKGATKTRDVEIRWTEDGLDDPTGLISAAAAAGEAVQATATGPYFAAATEPEHVALLTACYVLERVDAVEAPEALAELQRLSAVPAGATP